MGDRLLFLKLWWRAPLRIAAWSPSSETLGRAIARHVDPRSPLPVLELGGGTGTVTRALIDLGVRPELLYVIEREPELCALLRERFPGATILEGDAGQLGTMLRERGVTRLSAVVSTLPIIWFPPALQRSIADQAFALLGRGAFLQMTNQPRSPLAHRALGLRGRIVNFVWRNLPPSFVWRYERERPA